SADDALSILVYLVACARLKCVFMLRIHIPAADCNRIQFVRTDATIQQLLAAGLTVEGPFHARFHQRYGEGPVLVPHQDECAIRVLSIHGNLRLLAGLRGEISSAFTILREFAAEDNVSTIRTED